MIKTTRMLWSCRILAICLLHNCNTSYVFMTFFVPGICFTNLLKDSDIIMPLGLDVVQENNIAGVLADNEFLGSYAYRSYIDTPKAGIESNDLDGFHFFLLNQANRLSIGRQRSSLLEQALLREFCAFEPTISRQRMLTTLFDPMSFVVVSALISLGILPCS